MSISEQQKQLNCVRTEGGAGHLAYKYDDDEDDVFLSLKSD